MRDVCDVRREFRDNRSLRDFFGPRGNHFRVFGDLADGGAHAALAHAVGAAEIQFERVGAGIFGAADDVVPGFAFGFDHEGGDDEIFGVAFFYFGDLAQIYGDGAVADQFDIVEAHHFYAV